MQLFCNVHCQATLLHAVNPSNIPTRKGPTISLYDAYQDLSRPVCVADSKKSPFQRGQHVSKNNRGPSKLGRGTEHAPRMHPQTSLAQPSSPRYSAAANTSQAALPPFSPSNAHPATYSQQTYAPAYGPAGYPPQANFARSAYAPNLPQPNMMGYQQSPMQRPETMGRPMQMPYPSQPYYPTQGTSLLVNHLHGPLLLPHHCSLSQKRAFCNKCMPKERALDMHGLLMQTNWMPNVLEVVV